MSFFQIIIFKIPKAKGGSTDTDSSNSKSPAPITEVELDLEDVVDLP